MKNLTLLALTTLIALGQAANVAPAAVAPVVGDNANRPAAAVLEKQAPVAAVEDRNQKVAAAAEDRSQKVAAAAEDRSEKAAAAAEDRGEKVVAAAEGRDQKAAAEGRDPNVAAEDRAPKVAAALEATAIAPKKRARAAAVVERKNPVVAAVKEGKPKVAAVAKEDAAKAAVAEKRETVEEGKPVVALRTRILKNLSFMRRRSGGAVRRHAVRTAIVQRADGDDILAVDRRMRALGAKIDANCAMKRQGSAGQEGVDRDFKSLRTAISARKVGVSTTQGGAKSALSPTMIKSYLRFLDWEEKWISRVNASLRRMWMRHDANSKADGGAKACEKAPTAVEIKEAVPKAADHRSTVVSKRVEAHSGVVKGRIVRRVKVVRHRVIVKRTKAASKPAQ